MKLKNLFGRWIHRGALTSTSLTVLLGAGSASAVEPSPIPLCPTPTLSTCQGEDYLTSYCGQQHSSLCNDLIGQEYEQQWAALTLEHTTLLPKVFGDTLGLSRPTAYTALPSTYVETGKGSYAGAVLKNQVLYRKSFQNLSASDIAQRDARLQWDANGTNIRSCEEYVHEKNADYSRWEDAMGAHGTDYRAMFEAAYAPEGIAYKTLKGKEGNTLAPIFSLRVKAPKNLYFKALQSAYPAGMQGYAIDPELLALVPLEGRTYYAPSWQWHEDMSASLANAHDAYLDRLFGKQLEFSSLVERRKDVWAAYSRQAQELTGIPLEQLKQRVTSELIGLDQAIEAGLQEAQADGCLGLNGNPLCDWSPRRFVTMVSTEMLNRRTGDYNLCLAMTSNDFGSASFVRNAEALGIAGLAGDYATSTARLGEYMNTYRQAVLGMSRLIVPSTSETRRSESRSDSGSFGNSNFSAAYNYGAGWALNTTSSLGMCTSFDARIYAYFESDARLFGSSFEVFDASAEGTATKDEVGYDVSVSVLGANVYHSGNTFPTSFSVTPSKSVRQTFATVSSRFLLLGVPVKVSAGLSGTIGVDTALSGQYVSGCKFKLSGEMKPYARLDVFAEAAVDVVVVAVGVRGELSLISAELPFDASLYVYLDTEVSKLMLDLDSNLRLKLSTLDGRIVVFARAFGHTAEKELASFHGASSTTTLLDENRSIPLHSFF